MTTSTTTKDTNNHNVWSTDGTNAAAASSVSQEEFMAKDTVIVVNEKDVIMGSASKKTSHIFSMDQSRGILHRAFSVFLFDTANNTLLLQQRASTKITFPNVWTNTCCSHPLHGMDVTEVDTDDNIANGTVPGVKAAAIRKLHQELGIPPLELDMAQFQFLTRLHYWAADTVTHGPNSPWGEHEIDYVLFYTIDSSAEDYQPLTIVPHPEEVDAVKWVTKAQLIDMMADTKLLFSPWFRLICQKWLLPTWWPNDDDEGSSSAKDRWINQVMCRPHSKFADYTTIHRFDPPPEHYGGGGNAQGPWLTTIKKQATTTTTTTTNGTKTVGDTSKKQGAYGKIPTFSESKLSQLLRLDEVLSAVTLLYIKPLKSNLDHVPSSIPADDLAFCDEILGKVSRSFAAVIRQLPKTMLVDVLVFYLVLRALDTIEDDTAAFDGNVATKVKALKEFHTTALKDPNWTMDGVGEGDELRLLQHFGKCQRVLAALRPEAQVVITDICQRMADGMAEFVEKDMGQGTATMEEYNRYCHFVAGLVGEGLSRLFAASGLESPDFAKEIFLSDQMGKFLQKVNIIRDYLEDYVDGRAWWPKTVWDTYIPEDSKADGLGYFARPPLNSEKERHALHCLNALVTDALELAPSCLEYMSRLQCQQIFRFCAIPQVMAIATLDKLYNNRDVFWGVVKIRKGLSCQLILQTNNQHQLHAIFHSFATSLARKAIRNANKDDPKNFQRTVRACNSIISMTKAKSDQQKFTKVIPVVMTLLLLVSTLTVSSSEATRKGVFVLLAFGYLLLGRLMQVPNELEPAEVLERKLAKKKKKKKDE